jgi:hypothetical protein
MPHLFKNPIGWHIKQKKFPLWHVFCYNINEKRKPGFDGNEGKVASNPIFLTK